MNPNDRKAQEQADTSRNKSGGAIERAGYDFTKSEGYKAEMRRRRGQD